MKDVFAGIFGCIILAAIILLGVGWFMNIVELIQGNEDLFIKLIRIIGIFMAPVGGVMGWL